MHMAEDGLLRFSICHLPFVICHLKTSGCEEANDK